jgi:GrpB-like predicted nucleotidyltransferase (UPF0157 family)
MIEAICTASITLPSSYTFTEYSPTWPSEFEAEAERLRILLGKKLVAVHHIGSTAVPGLAAKPVIDLLPIVREMMRVDERTAAMELAGYKAWGEYGIAGRRLFTKDRDGVRTHNVHLFAIGSPEIERHLAFCVYLRAHAEARREYEALKRAVYARHPADIAAYMDGKDVWIKRIEPLAVAWYRQAGP